MQGVDRRCWSSSVTIHLITRVIMTHSRAALRHVLSVCLSVSRRPPRSLVHDRSYSCSILCFFSSFFVILCYHLFSSCILPSFPPCLPPPLFWDYLPVISLIIICVSLTLQLFFLLCFCSFIFFFFTVYVSFILKQAFF